MLSSPKPIIEVDFLARDRSKRIKRQTGSALFSCACNLPRTFSGKSAGLWFHPLYKFCALPSTSLQPDRGYYAVMTALAMLDDSSSDCAMIQGEIDPAPNILALEPNNNELKPNSMDSTALCFHHKHLVFKLSLSSQPRAGKGLCVCD